MTTTLRILSRLLGSLILTVMVGVPVAFAGAVRQRGTVPAATTIKPGDRIAVTRWSGAKLEGQVVEATECSISIRSGNKLVDVPRAAIKTMRRYPPPKQNRGARAMLDVADTCEQVDCAPAALAYVGFAAIFQGFEDLGRRPEIVYRGKRDEPIAPSCLPDAREGR